MAELSPALRVQDLRKVYGSKAAVDGLSLTVPRGCFFGFLGPNGAGKTTTIKMLMGLAPPTSGSIELLGMSLPEHALEIKQLIGLVPDESLLFDHLTGGEFIEFVGRIYGLERAVARARSAELLDLFELGRANRKMIAEYSKGMRKRVAMAAALIHRPQLFLMDEPFEGVDAVGARLMKDILLDQVRHGATIFLTSHVLEVVERLCDRVAIINEGRIGDRGFHGGAARRVGNARRRVRARGGRRADLRDPGLAVWAPCDARARDPVGAVAHVRNFYPSRREWPGTAYHRRSGTAPGWWPPSPRRVFSAARTISSVMKAALPGGLLLVFLYWQVVPLLMAATGASLDDRASCRRTPSRPRSFSPSRSCCA
jgi:ABC-2 type transport system ATP-binding protein